MAAVSDEKHLKSKRIKQTWLVNDVEHLAFYLKKYRNISSVTYWSVLVNTQEFSTPSYLIHWNNLINMSTISTPLRSAGTTKKKPLALWIRRHLFTTVHPKSLYIVPALFNCYTVSMHAQMLPNHQYISAFLCLELSWDGMLSLARNLNMQFTSSLAQSDPLGAMFVLVKTWGSNTYDVYSSPLPCLDMCASTWTVSEATISRGLRHSLRNMLEHRTIVFTLIKWTGRWGRAYFQAQPPGLNMSKICWSHEATIN